jgi:H+-translocating NAD(P) transhydrogenase subunit beta
LKETRDTPQTNVSIALALSLGGAAQLVAGLWNSQAILLVTGGIVLVAGVSLARAMAHASGRALGQLLFGGSAASNAFGYGNVRHSDPEGAAMILAASQNVIIIPGYGLARAQGQHAVKELVERLEKSGAKVRIIVHHAAGIVPGHMNALLDEAGIAHNKLVESHDAAAALVGADVVVVGANDIVNSDAANQAGSLFGLDALNLSKAASVWVIKRSLGHGQGDVRNNLFELPQSTMVLGDAKKVVQALVAELKNSAH